MPIIIGTHPYSQEMAEEMAQLNNAADEDGWRYDAVCIDEVKNYWGVTIRDKTGELVGYL